MLQKEDAKYSQATGTLERAISIYGETLGPGHPKIAESLDELAFVYITLEKYGEAEPLSRRALAIREEALGPEHPDAAMTLTHLGQIHSAQGDFAEAVSFYEHSLRIQEEIPGYKSHRLETVSKRTTSKELSYLSSMMTWAEENDLCNPLPFKIKGFPKRQTRPPRPRPLSPEEITALYEAIEPEYKLILLLLADAGLRKSEA